MKRTLAALGVVAALASGAATAGPYMTGTTWGSGDQNADGLHWGARYAPSVPNMQGPYGQPVPMVAPYNANPPGGADVARAMLQQSMPMDLLQAAYNNGSGGGMGGGMPGGMGGMGNGLMQMGGPMPPGMPPMAGIAPPGMPLAPGMPPPPKPAPGNYPVPPGAVNAMGAILNPPATPFPVSRTEVKFVGPGGMKISWFAPSADGRPGFSSQYLEAPGRYNFLQASFYRLKIYDIPNRAGVTLYPTLEVVPCKAKTAAFLAHSAVPVAFTEDDFEQVAAGNYVVKVIYLPDPQFQDLASTAIDEVVSTRLEPGMDPIVEAQRRGSILLVVRLGNIDLEAPNTPAMDAPNPFAPPPPAVPVPAAPAPAAPAGPGMPPGAPGQLPAVPAQPTGPQQPGPGPEQLPPGVTPPQGGGFPGGGMGFLPPPPMLQQAAGGRFSGGR